MSINLRALILDQIYGINTLVYDDGAGDPPAGDPPAGDPPAGGDDGGDDGADDLNADVKLTDAQKKHVEKLIKERVDRVRKQTDLTVKQLETLKQDKALTDKQKQELQQRIDDIEAAHMTKAELAVKERQKEAKKYEQTLAQLQAENKKWQDKFYDTTIRREIVDAAAKADAYRVEQVVTILQGKTRLVEITDANGQGTGEFETRVKFEGRDSANKPMEMDLTVVEAIAEMQKMPAEYGNLFKSGLKDGLGSNTVPGSNGRLTETVLSSQDEYMKNRQRIKETVR